MSAGATLAGTEGAAVSEVRLPRGSLCAGGPGSAGVCVGPPALRGYSVFEENRNFIMSFYVILFLKRVGTVVSKASLQAGTSS